MTSDEALEYGKEWYAAIESREDTAQSDALTFLAWANLALQARKPGKWIRTKSGLLCSACRSGVKNQPLLMGKPLFLYCPFCGVNVEGVDDES